MGFKAAIKLFNDKAEEKPDNWRTKGRAAAVKR